MTFLAPSLLWGLLALIPLAAVFFLKVRPRKKETNAFFLWQKVFEEKKASALFRRLRDVISLLLLLLAAAAIVFAMARPKVGADDGRDLVLVVDISASMAAGPEGKRGIELAREKAQDIVKALNGTRRMALASFSDQLEFVSHLSDSPKDLIRSVRGLEVREVPVSENARKALREYAAAGEKYRVILLTDGHGGLDNLGENVEVMRVGKPLENAGLVEADFDWLPGSSTRAGFFYRVASSFTGKKQAELELRNVSTGAIARLIPIELEPGVAEPQVVELDQAAPGEWQAILHVVDDFRGDNEVLMVLPEQRKIPVRIAAQQTYFFQRCVEAFEQSGGLLTLAEGVPAELLLVQGSTDAPEPALVFAPAGGEEAEVLTAEALIEDHPLLRHLDLEGMSFIGAKTVTPPEGAIILAKSESGLPLIYKAGNKVYLNLDPAQGDFFLSPWFPVLVHDAARHLTASEGDYKTVYPTGTLVEGKLLETTGRHDLKKGVSFGAALLNAGESLLNADGPAESSLPIAQGRPPAIWLLLLALLVITVECVLYHRRKVG